MGTLGGLKFQVCVYMRHIHVYMYVHGCEQSMDCVCGRPLNPIPLATLIILSILIEFLGISGLIFSQKFIQTSGSFSLCSIISR